MSYPELKTPLNGTHGGHSLQHQQRQGLSRPKQTKWICHERETSTSRVWKRQGQGQGQGQGQKKTSNQYQHLGRIKGGAY